MEEIVGLGEILWDIFPDGAVLGGAPCNFAMHPYIWFLLLGENFYDIAILDIIIST